MGLQWQTEEHVLQQFLSEVRCIEYLISFSGYNYAFSSEFQETCYPVVFASFTIASMGENKELGVHPTEIIPRKTSYIGVDLSTKQKEWVIKMIQRYSREFAWDYLDMK